MDTNFAIEPICNSLICVCKYLLNSVYNFVLLDDWPQIIWKLKTGSLQAILIFITLPIRKSTCLNPTSYFAKAVLNTQYTSKPNKRKSTYSQKENRTLESLSNHYTLNIVTENTCLETYEISFQKQVIFQTHNQII